MSEKIVHDSENNILYVSKNQNKTKELRGFIVTIANKKEDVALIQSGDHTKMQLAPVMAPEEQDAINVIAQAGKIPLSIESYEYLKFKTSLLEELANKENIGLLTKQFFKNETI